MILRVSETLKAYDILIFDAVDEAEILDPQSSTDVINAFSAALLGERIVLQSDGAAKIDKLDRESFEATAFTLSKP